MTRCLGDEGEMLDFDGLVECREHFEPATLRCAQFGVPEKREFSDHSRMILVDADRFYFGRQVVIP